MDSYIGIDPGASGAICAYVPELQVIEFLATTMQPHKIIESIRNLNSTAPIKMIMIEDVHSVQNSSAKSNFSFGRNLGLLQGIMLSTSHGLDLVQPKVWQKFIGVKPAPRAKKGAPKVPAGVRSRALKKEVAQICGRLYPSAEIYGPKGGLLDGRSDALMICHYNYLKYK